MKSAGSVSHASLIEDVKGALIRNEAQDGEAMTEAILCRRLKVSRGAIRDALAQLESQGLIERKKKKGTLLRRPTLKEIVDLWDSRSALEGVAARLAASKIKSTELEKLTEIIARRDAAAARNDQRAVDQGDIDFHQTIIDIADNGCVRDIVRNIHLFDRIFRYPERGYSIDDENAAYSHKAIIEALGSIDPDRAEDTMKRHIQHAKKRRVEAMIGKVNLFE
jgi:DNA-binding GntR family transcriptional regulator